MFIVIFRTSPILSCMSNLSVNHDDNAATSDIDDLIGINSDNGYESNMYSEQDESSDVNYSESESDEHSIESDLDVDSQTRDEDFLERSSYSKYSSSAISRSNSEEEVEEMDEYEEQGECHEDCSEDYLSFPSEMRCIYLVVHNAETCPCCQRQEESVTMISLRCRGRRACG